MDLENEVQGTVDVQRSEGLIKRMYREEWPTIGNHLLACGVSISAATGFSAYAEGNIKSDAVISGIATGIDAVGYWGTLLPQFAWRDRHKMKGEDGRFERRKVLKKLGEYAGFVGLMEGLWLGLRFFGQYYLQKEGWDPATASATVQVSGTAFFTAFLPPIRYGMRKLFER